MILGLLRKKPSNHNANGFREHSKNGLGLWPWPSVTTLPSIIYGQPLIILFFVSLLWECCLVSCQAPARRNLLKSGVRWKILYCCVWCPPDASQTQCFEIRHQAQDFKTLRLIPARRQPDAMFQNLLPDAIFCDHASDVQYESSYVGLPDMVLNVLLIHITKSWKGNTLGMAYWLFLADIPYLEQPGDIQYIGSTSLNQYPTPYRQNQTQSIQKISHFYFYFEFKKIYENFEQNCL